jgi:hypothetical protein
MASSLGADFQHHWHPWPGILSNLLWVWLVRILLFFSSAWALDLGWAQLADLTPQPDLSPEQVVQYQVTSLQQNDNPKSDAGIERTFRFASPSNKEATGPLEKFVRIVKSPAYSPLLNNRASSILGSEVQGNQAKVGVKIVAADGREWTYVFILTKQSEGDFNNCWMTDGVEPLKDAESGSDQGVTI